MITINGKEFRNLVEQVAKNQEDIKKHYEIEQTLADWGIKVIGRLDEWEPPTDSFAFGDAYAVGPEGGPFDFYIWTRRSNLDDEGYWLNYGPISIVGPQGPQGEPGPQGETGKAGRWYVGPSEPTGNVNEGDLWLRVNNDGSTNGFVYQYGANGWALSTTIKGPQGIRGKDGKEGKQGPPGPQGPQGKDGNPSPVINIIAELPEGTVISDIYNPSGVASNSGILMPVGGVNHLWIIINGMWTDSGSWGQGGTRVYVGGEEVVEFNADTKVNKQNPGYTAVYAVGDNGNEVLIPVAPGGVRDGNKITRYSPGGIIQTGNPVNNYDCANKLYVDNKIAEAHNGGTIKSYVWYGQGGTVAGGQIQLGIYLNEFQKLSITGGTTVEIPAMQIYYQMSSGTSIYYCVPWCALKFELEAGTWEDGKYKISFIDAGAAAGVLEADCTVDNNNIMTINTGYGATGAGYGYAVLVVPPYWSSEW